MKKGTFGQWPEGSERGSRFGYGRKSVLARENKYIAWEATAHLLYKKQWGQCGWNRMGRVGATGGGRSVVVLYAPLRTWYLFWIGREFWGDIEQRRDKVGITVVPWWKTEYRRQRQKQRYQFGGCRNNPGEIDGGLNQVLVVEVVGNGC